jgi:LacI family transcriptional regulator
VTAGGGRIVDPLYLDGANTQLSLDEQAAKWLRSLPKGTAVLATCDEWGAILVLACRLAGVAVPEDVAVIGVDDDDLVCEMCQPHMSSVRIPWQEIGRTAARMVESVLRTDKNPMKIIRLPPSGVVERRSTELLAAGHPVVVQALRYLRSQAHEPINVEDVVHQVTANRRWLERAFRTYLGRSILQEIRRAHMDRARHLLATTRLPMTAVAHSCGFGSAIARFSRTFNKDVGMTPSAYRRKFSLNR